MIHRRAATVVAVVIGAALAVAGCTPPPAVSVRPDTYSLGRNAIGEPCVASRDWHDPALTTLFDQSWKITCRNVAASRPLGTIRVASGGVRAAERSRLDCGDAKAMTVAGFGAVEARRCYDPALGTDTVAYDVRKGGRRYYVSATAEVLGPAEEGARLLAGLATPSTDAGRAVPSSIAVADVPPLRAAQRTMAASDAFDPAVALTEGINLNHQGLHVEASRVLNDALSRLPATTAPSIRAELLLEAGLADSNIRFSASAEQHFAEADALLPAIDGARGEFLTRKHDAYVALDLLNQRRFKDALAALDRLVTPPVAAGEPLRNAAIVRLLNQTAQRSTDVSRSIAVPQTAELAQLTLDAQASWARSIAMLALGDTKGAQSALDRAQAAYNPLINERIDPTLVLWLGAQIDRQRGRLEARRGQYGPAIASFDRALAELRRSSVGTSGTGNGPTIAETEFEQARIVADAGGDPASIRARYDAAVDALIAANRASGGGIPPSGIERYLDLLVAEAGGRPRPDTDDRFFRAMQAVGEPAVARQLTQLQRVVDADPAIGVKVRDRAELERSITRLRYEIAAGGAGSGVSLADLEKERSGQEARLLQINAQLSSSPRFRTVDDRPATIAEVRQALRPGEVYLKMVALPSRDYAIVIAGDRTWIYPLALPADEVAQLAGELRRSIDGRLLAAGTLVPFDVARSYALFRLLTGPAIDAVLAATGLVIDTAGPLQAVPAGVLVTDRASVATYEASRAAAPFDFSHVAFLAARLPISTALSPRSFLVVRALPPSTAPHQFLGLGEHQPAWGDGPKRVVNVGFGCQVDFATLADLSRRLKPIDRRELTIAATALGDPSAPEITGAAFSDTAIEQRRDLSDFQVLHFATHGIEEGVWGCSKSPPALVTSFGGAGSDGLLSFAEIAELRLDANLVVLSACDTAAGVTDETLARRSGQEEAGSTLEGLVRAFLTANSRAVLATLWPVSADQETDRFIGTFYRAARDQTIGGALKTAQQGLIAVPAYSHPFYWGPYFIVGDATKTMLTHGTDARMKTATDSRGPATIAARQSPAGS